LPVSKRNGAAATAHRDRSLPANAELALAAAVSGGSDFGKLAACPTLGCTPLGDVSTVSPPKTSPCGRHERRRPGFFETGNVQARSVPAYHACFVERAVTLRFGFCGDALKRGSRAETNRIESKSRSAGKFRVEKSNTEKSTA